MSVLPRSTAGFSMIEVVVAAGLCLAAVLGIVGAFLVTVKASQGNLSRVQAVYLEEEGLESVRILRDNGWTTNVAAQPTGTKRYLEFDGTTWKATTTNAYIGPFERSVIFDAVYRDGSQNIASTGTLDLNMKKVTVSVSWRSGAATSTRSLVTYLSNIFNN